MCSSLVRTIIAVIIAMTIIIVTTLRQMLERLRGALVQGVLGVWGGTNFMGSLELKGFICYSPQSDALSSAKTPREAFSSKGAIYFVEIEEETQENEGHCPFPKHPQIKSCLCWKFLFKPNTHKAMIMMMLNMLMLTMTMAKVLKLK